MNTFKHLRILLAAISLIAGLVSPAFAAEPPGKRGAGGLPVGAYSSSCTCQFSGGVELSCFCANLQAKWFRTTMDVRSCTAPRDIKNCEGVLTCTASGTTQCPPTPLSQAVPVSKPIK